MLKIHFSKRWWCRACFRLFISTILSTVCLTAFGSDNQTETGLTLPAIMAKVLKESPALAQYPYRIRAREALALQAGLRPNPELSLELENVAGSGRFANGDAMESTLAFSQVIEMGRERDRRQALGEWRSSSARDDFELARLDVLAEAARQFLAVAEAQALLDYARQHAKGAESAARMARERHRAGSISQAELSRARSDAMRARLSVKRHEARLGNERTRLAAHWGSSSADFDRVEAALYSLPDLPGYAAMEKRLKHSPRIERFTTRRRLQQAAVDLAQAQGQQDITVGLGMKHDSASGDSGLNLQLSMPLGTSNRNQGEIRAARAELAAIDEAQQSSQLQMNTQLQTGYRHLVITREQLKALREDILPESIKAQNLYREGYRQGRFSYLELVEARHQRASVEREAISAAVVFHQTLITLEALTGEAIARLHEDNSTPQKHPANMTKNTDLIR